jgi:hypothetical protein
VKLPATIPDGFELESIRQWWPGWLDVDSRQRKIHADYFEFKYTQHEGYYLRIIQGFTGLIIAFTELDPPSESTGSLKINDRNAVWLTALPAPGAGIQRINGRHVITDWTRGNFAYVGWHDGIHPPPAGGQGESPRYYGLASDTLTVAELASVAETVPLTTFVISP